MGNQLKVCCDPSPKYINDGRDIHKDHIKNKKAEQFLRGEKNDDAELFDSAWRNKDIKVLIALMQSTQTVVLSENLHEWAENPQTIGDLAILQLAVIASKGESIEEMTNSENRAILMETVRDGLLSKTKPRIHGSILLLHSLITNWGDEEAPETYTKAGFFDISMDILLNPTEIDIGTPGKSYVGSIIGVLALIEQNMTKLTEGEDNQLQTLILELLSDKFKVGDWFTTLEALYCK